MEHEKSQVFCVEEANLAFFVENQVEIKYFLNQIYVILFHIDFAINFTVNEFLKTRRKNNF